MKLKILFSFSRRKTRSVSSSYPSVFCLAGSFPSGIVASHSIHCCLTVSSCVSDVWLLVLKSRFSHGLFSGYCSFKDVYYKIVMPKSMPYPWVASIFLNFLKVIFLLSPFEELQYSLLYPFIIRLTFFSSTMFQNACMTLSSFFPRVHVYDP